MRYPFLRGNSVHLVILSEEDVPVITAGMNNHTITQYLSRGDWPMTEASEKEWVASVHTSKTELVLGIYVPKEDVLIGTVGLHGISRRDQHAELGISISNPDFHGKGVGSEVVTLILEHAFTRMNLKGVSLGVLSNNPRGIRCYQKCGFVEVGRYPKWIFKEGAWHDHIIMVAIRP